MHDDTMLPFSLPSVGGKKVLAAFDGGRLTSDGGAMLLALAERRLNLAERLACGIADHRDPARVQHPLADILRARMLAIACGYEDADDLDHLRTDPALKLACGRLPDSGRNLPSQPTVSRWENAPSLREVIGLMRIMVDVYCASYTKPPAAVTLDIDDTCDVVHGHQQLSLFNSHYGERCFLPIHVYDTATSRPVAVLLRPGKTPSGREVRAHLRRLVRLIRRHWPATHLTIRGDGHYGRPEVMAWCEDQGIDFVFGLPGNDVLRAAVEIAADDVRSRRAEQQVPALRGYTETRYAARSWGRQRRAVARIEATLMGLDSPLRGHQPAPWQCRVGLRHAVLRPRPGREPDKDAQGPARLRPHILPLAAGKPDAPHPAHRCLLAAAERARCYPGTADARPCGVRHHPPAPAQDRRPHHRDRQPCAHRVRRRLSASCALPQPDNRPRTVAPLGKAPLSPSL